MPVCELPEVRDATYCLAWCSRLLAPCAARAGGSRVRNAGMKVYVRQRAVSAWFSSVFYRSSGAGQGVTTQCLLREE